MDTLSTVNAVNIVNLADITNLFKDVAQLNLGYLGISVTILVILGGAFVLFNINPLKEELKKHEKIMSNLKERADKLLDRSIKQTDIMIKNFEKEQTSIITKKFVDQSEKIEIETENKINDFQNLFTEKIEIVSEGKDNKLKELIDSQIKNLLGVVEKNITLEIKKNKESLENKIEKNNTEIENYKFKIKELKRDIKELKVYKFAQEGKMGAIIYSIELLKDDIDDECSWRIPNDLENLEKNIDGCNIDPNYIARIEKQLARIENYPQYKILIDRIKKIYSIDKIKEN
jgi:hypothetical protein